MTRDACWARGFRHSKRRLIVQRSAHIVARHAARHMDRELPTADLRGRVGAAQTKRCLIVKR
jgi:hypothetical protein